ncbi:MAG TPA: universal stress protein [Gaiellaceae bacterium]|jgi:nucleotide-binding universal stress UspA family protein
MIPTIVCGVDGSRNATVALGAAARLADQLDARLVVAHVVQGGLASRTTGVGRDIEAELAAGERLLDDVLDGEELRGLERQVVLGFPADQLADLADAEEAELIVVGSRGRGALRAAFLGSVSTDLIGVARCPVLVVPPGAVTPSPTGHEPALAGRERR